MAMKFKWYGDEVAKGVNHGVRQNLADAASYLVRVIRADISQPGSLTYNVKGTSNKGAGRRKKIYNFTHSRPGNPPYKQTGMLRNTIRWRYVNTPLTIVARVQPGVKYGEYLEKGTKRMAARPYIAVNLRKHAGTVRQIMNRRIDVKRIGPVSSNQFRSGHLGSGAYRLGYS